MFPTPQLHTLGPPRNFLLHREPPQSSKDQPCGAEKPTRGGEVWSLRTFPLRTGPAESQRSCRGCVWESQLATEPLTVSPPPKTPGTQWPRVPSIPAWIPRSHKPPQEGRIGERKATVYKVRWEEAEGPRLKGMRPPNEAHSYGHKSVFTTQPE